MRSPRILILALLTLAMFCGCGGGPAATSTTEEATVKGTVTINGKPATGGTVEFDPSNINRREAPHGKCEIGKDGSYSVKTLVGENSIMISGPEVTAAKIDMAKKFLDVKSGENDFPITLP
jgi:hypothetical protein